MGKVEALLREALATQTLKSYGRAGGGCINEGEGFMTDSGPVFVKKNKKSQAKLMFDGEFESLAALHATNTIRVPKPIKVRLKYMRGEVIYRLEGPSPFGRLTITCY